MLESRNKVSVGFSVPTSVGKQIEYVFQCLLVLANRTNFFFLQCLLVLSNRNGVFFFNACWCRQTEIMFFFQRLLVLAGRNNVFLFLPVPAGVLSCV